MASGGCMCGAIRYDITTAPLFTAICHCRQCRKQGGSAFSLVTGYVAAGFGLTGTTRVYDDVGDSGAAVARHFCGDCGSPLFSLADALPGVVIVKAGTLDDASALVPTIEAYCDGALPFMPALSGTTRHARSNI